MPRPPKRVRPRRVYDASARRHTHTTGAGVPIELRDQPSGVRAVHVWTGDEPQALELAARVAEELAADDCTYSRGWPAEWTK